MFWSACAICGLCAACLYSLLSCILDDYPLVVDQYFDLIHYCLNFLALSLYFVDKVNAQGVIETVADVCSVSV